MSSIDSTDVRYRVQPGVVSAAYFVLFDLVLLAFVDIVLARIVCYLYYRRINKGASLEVRSVDIPGLTTFLIGRRFAFPNVLALFTKIIILACILLVDLNIDSNVVTPKMSLKRNSTYIFDPSDEQWEREPSLNVTRRWELVRRCHEIDRILGNITYYSLAFDLSENTVTYDGGKTVYNQPNDSTIVCLKEGNVESADARVATTIAGCSQHFGKTLCTNASKIYKNYDLDSALNQVEPYILGFGTPGSIESYVFWNLDASLTGGIFSEYTQPNLTCARLRMGAPALTMLKDFYGCTVVEYKDGLTLVDKWRYDDSRKLMWRDYPGPLFEGNIKFGLHAALEVLRGFYRVENWETISGIIVADSSFYQQNSTTFTQFENSYIVTKVSPYAIALVVFLVLLAIVSRIVVAFTIGKDSRPQINSIDGLSSVAREESEPTGHSYVAGRNADIGLCHRGGRGHFGPLKSRDEAVRREYIGDLELPS